MRVFKVIIPTGALPHPVLGDAMRNAVITSLTLPVDTPACEVVARAVPYLRGNNYGKYELVEDYLGEGVYLVTIRHRAGARDFAYVVAA